jgi:hypothetical protein
MRKLWITFALMSLLGGPIRAQFGPGAVTVVGDMLLMNKRVQAELKLDDKQKKALREITRKQREMGDQIREAFEDGEKKKAMELAKKSNEQTARAIKEFKKGMTSAQSKRFQEILVQIATKNNDLTIFFLDEAVARALKLTGKQKKVAREALTDLAKDAKELLDNAKGDFTKILAVGKKVAGLKKDAFEKYIRELSSEQKKAWKDLAGKEFELKMGGPGPSRDKGKTGGKDKKEKPKTDGA